MHVEQRAIQIEPVGSATALFWGVGAAGVAGFFACDTPSLPRMAGQMLLARCVVGNDTGPMHLAAMLGVPTVTLYFHGSEWTWFPYGGDGRAEHVALSPGCSQVRCMASCSEEVSCGKKIALGAVAAALKGRVGIDAVLKRETRGENDGKQMQTFS